MSEERPSKRLKKELNEIKESNDKLRRIISHLEPKSTTSITLTELPDDILAIIREYAKEYHLNGLNLTSSVEKLKQLLKKKSNFNELCFIEDLIMNETKQYGKRSEFRKEEYKEYLKKQLNEEELKKYNDIYENYCSKLNELKRYLKDKSIFFDRNRDEYLRNVKRLFLDLYKIDDNLLKTKLTGLEKRNLIETLKILWDNISIQSLSREEGRQIQLYLAKNTMSL
jgi:hypothetical protein